MRGRFSIVLIVAVIAGLGASILVYRTVAQMRAAASRGPEVEDILVASAPIDIAEAVEKFELFLKTRNHDGLIQYIDGLMPSFAESQIPRIEIQDYSSEASLAEMPS